MSADSHGHFSLRFIVPIACQIVGTTDGQASRFGRQGRAMALAIQRLSFAMGKSWGVAGKLTPSDNQNQVVASPMVTISQGTGEWLSGLKLPLSGLGQVYISLPSTMQKKPVAENWWFRILEKELPNLLIELMVFSMRKKCLWLDPATTSQDIDFTPTALDIWSSVNHNVHKFQFYHSWNDLSTLFGPEKKKNQALHFTTALGKSVAQTGPNEVTQTHPHVL